MTSERTIATTTHGRYLLDLVGSVGSRLLIVGFHGYAEQAPLQLERLRALRGSSAINLVAIQGLHRFYRSGTEEIAASWMTREDRDLAIADNITYVDCVLDAVAREYGEPSAVVFVGFSQGASMAYRAAALGSRVPAGVVALGGDIPPELGDRLLARTRRVLIGRGVRERFYTAEKMANDRDRLQAAGVPVDVVEIDGGHAWTDQFTQAAADWLLRLS